MFLLGKSNLLAISLPAAARALEQSGALGKVKLTGLAPASLIKKYIVDGKVQDIWGNGTDLGYLYSLYCSKRNFLRCYNRVVLDERKIRSRTKPLLTRFYRAYW